MQRHSHPVVPLGLLIAGLLVGCAAEPEPSVVPDSSMEALSPPPQPERAWLDPSGTSIVGFGALRLVPPPGTPPESPARFRIHYEDSPDGYTVTDNVQLFVLPGDCFADKPAAFADEMLAFTRTRPRADPYGPDDELQLRLTADVEVAEETVVLVAYGAWTGPDTGRPPGDEHTFTLDVEPLPAGDGRAGAFAWLESEAGELITTNWTGRPEVERGGPVADPVAGAPAWIEVRPLILYDPRLVRANDEPEDVSLAEAPGREELLAEADALEARGDLRAAADRRERAADLAAAATRRDQRIVMTPELAEMFRRVPIRWR